MKIALMTNNYKPFTGGVPISIERLAKGLETLGHEVTIFAPTYQQTDSTVCREEHNVFRYRTLLNRFVGGIVLPNPFDGKIEEEFRKQKFDLIHVHHPMLIGRTAVYLSRKYRIPLVFTYHTRYEQYVKSYSKGRLNLDSIMPYFLHKFMNRCSYVFAPTEGMKAYLHDVCKIAPEKIGILPTGVDCSRFQVSQEGADAIRTAYHADGIPLLISVSRMAREKNVEFLLYCIAETKKLYREPFRVLLVGDGPERTALEELANRLGLGQEVTFTRGIPNEEIAAYYKAADGFIFASKTETQGIVILEAFAGSTPVVAVKATGVEDLVRDGENGILTEEDVGTYAYKLAGFLKSVAWGNTLYQTLSKGAARTAYYFREEAIALKAEHYYNDVIADYEMQEKRSVRPWSRNIVY